MKHKQQGFSMTELLVVMAVLAIVAAIASQYFGENIKYILLGEQKSSRIAGISQGKNFLYKDFRNSSPSFQFFNTTALIYDLETPPVDCTVIGEAGEKAVFWNITEKESCQGYELILSEPGHEFTFLKNAIGAKVDAAILSPHKAYKINANKTVLFKKSKLKNALEDIDLEDQNLLKLQAAANIENGAGKMLNYAAIYNLKSNELQNLDSYNIVTLQCDLGAIGNIDQYFRCLPPNGLKKVKVTPVSLVTYRLISETKGTKTTRYIVRATTTDGTTTVKVRMFPNITSIRFFRETTTSPQISFEMDIPRAQYKK